ncbi:TPA: HU family DNA-binding protein [Vibrio parahaemolyticus]
MNKTQLIEVVSENAGISKAAAGKTLDTILETVKDTMAKGEEVALVGFGTFKVTKRAARAGRNPKTGETIQIAEANQPKFVAGKGLKDACNN